MLTGMIFTFGYIVYFKIMQPSANIPENWLFGISPEGIGFIGMIVNFTVAMAVAKFTKAPPARITAMVSNIRVPVGVVKIQ
jgi:cation/acetate symporter